MSIKDNGDPAFPSVPFPFEDGKSSYSAHPGMSLRDYFAAQALTMLAPRTWSQPDLELPAAWAKAAYMVADAMIAERSK